MAKLIKDKTPEEIRELFGLEVFYFKKLLKNIDKKFRTTCQKRKRPQFAARTCGATIEG